MTIAANQPYFLPYLPYWQLLSAADVFLIADDYSFRRSSWINRNIIQIEGKPLWMCLELKHQSSYKLIGETEILQDISPKKMETIRRAYKKAPFFEAGYAIAEKILFDSSDYQWLKEDLLGFEQELGEPRDEIELEGMQYPDKIDW